jgi:hypothetical protein
MGGGVCAIAGAAKLAKTNALNAKVRQHCDHHIVERRSVIDRHAPRNTSDRH